MRCLFLVLFFAGSDIFAAGARRGFEGARIAGMQMSYVGAAYKSLAEGSPAYGVELSLDKGGQYFRYYFKARYSNSLGSQNFSKDGVVFFSKYELTSFEPELGIYFYPISRNDKGLNIYFWGSGSFSYNSFFLKNIPSTITLTAKSQEFGSGYGAGMGFEFMLSGGCSRRYLFFSDIGFRDSRLNLAGQKAFQLSGMVVSFGLGF